MSIEHEVQLFRRAWGNGARSLLLAAGLFVLSLVILGGAVTIAWLAKPNVYAPLHNEVPQLVSPNATGVVHAGGIVEITGTKCINDSETVYVQGRSWWKRIDIAPNEIVPYLDGERAAVPGCLTRTFANMIPDDLNSGTWILEGVDIALQGDERQQEPWFSEEFVVEGRSE